MALKPNLHLILLCFLSVWSNANVFSFLKVRNEYTYVKLCRVLVLIAATVSSCSIHKTRWAQDSGVCICTFFPKLKSPGIYFCDDLHWSLKATLQVALAGSSDVELVSLHRSSRAPCLSHHMRTGWQDALARPSHHCCISAAALAMDSQPTWLRDFSEVLWGYIVTIGSPTGHICFCSSWRKCTRIHLIIFMGWIHKSINALCR